VDNGEEFGGQSWLKVRELRKLISSFGMEWMPCGETYANAVFFRIGVIAYNLFQALKLLGLAAWWHTATIGTVRWKLYQVAARLQTSCYRLSKNQRTQYIPHRLNLWYQSDGGL